jgi:hypothetical protein
MALVLKDKHTPVVHYAQDQGLGVLTWRSYIPLMVIICMITLVSLIVAWKEAAFPLQDFIVYVMTGFFLVFSAFKLMDLKGFAHGYATYDLLARQLPSYGYVYPFIELSFGLKMLYGFHPDWLLWTECAVMAFSGLGVLIKLLRREQFQCACLGTFLKVPLTYVTLLEDFGMAALALVLICLT